MQIATCAAALRAVEGLLDAARGAVRVLVVRDGRIDGARLTTHQFAAHGLAWYATYEKALRRMLGWAARLEKTGDFGKCEALMLRAAFGEYLAQMVGGIAMSQVEVVRPADLGIDDEALTAFHTAEVKDLMANGNSAATRAGIAELIADGNFGNPGLGDETLEMMEDQFTRFAAERITPYAQDWHRRDSLIPMALLEEMAELGVFGLTIPEEWGGLGLGKVAMGVVTEALSRGSLGVGSLATRSEIAGELIRLAGSEDQKRRWLPAIAGGEVLPTAVFTEPGVGSDLGSLRCRGVRDGDGWRITGNKTWITHGARADLMTLLVRTDPDDTGYKGISMFLAEKPRGGTDDPFPAPGMEGAEIKVLGYRGMKEYEIAFDGFFLPGDALLGGVPGRGFKQLMETFEAARIQTAARAVGVALNALDLGLAYGRERQQFGRAIYSYPRVSGKLAWMAVEIMIARQLTWFAGAEKDAGKRCDVEAGMAKLLAARTAWSAADNALQIHGGNGYAEEFAISRLLVDSRVLNIFEGAAEIQAQVIAKKILDGNL